VANGFISGGSGTAGPRDVKGERAGASTDIVEEVSGGMRDRLRSKGAAERPLLVGPDVAPQLPHTELVMALRRGAEEIVAAQRSIVEAGADAIVAPTSKTTAPALHRSGQAYRAAALTAAAIDLSRDAIFATRGRAWVLGEIDAEGAHKLRAEARTHIERLATSAVDGVLVRAIDADAAAEIARTALAHALAVVVEVEAADAERVASLLPAGATLLVRGDLESCTAAMDRVRRDHADLSLGVRLSPPSHRVQTWTTSAWDVVAQHAPVLVAFEGPGALDALRAVTTLHADARAPRAESR
jgi:hypothetical protein